MRRPLLLLATLAGACSTVSGCTRADGAAALVFHRTAGFEHASIPAGVDALEVLGADLGLAVVATDDAGAFTDIGLAECDVIVFLNTTGDVLDDGQQAAMERFIATGGGFVGIHAAADTDYGWEWYGGLVGAWFAGHPTPQAGTVHVIEPDHPVAAGLSATFEVTEEWYDYSSLPAAKVTILATVDESTYEGGGMGDPHPIAWAQEYGGGRSVYLGFGHDAEVFADPAVKRLLANALRWAAGP